VIPFLFNLIMSPVCPRLLGSCVRRDCLSSLPSGFHFSSKRSAKKG
jgi:hypothetical protein